MVFLLSGTIAYMYYGLQRHEVCRRELLACWWHPWRPTKKVWTEKTANTSAGIPLASRWHQFPTPCCSGSTLLPLFFPDCPVRLIRLVVVLCVGAPSWCEVGSAWPSWPSHADWDASPCRHWPRLAGRRSCVCPSLIVQSEHYGGRVCRRDCVCPSLIVQSLSNQNSMARRHGCVCPSLIV